MATYVETLPSGREEDPSGLPFDKTALAAGSPEHVDGLVDARTTRTLAYPCGDEAAGGASYVNAARPLFTAARGYKRGGKEMAEPVSVDVHRVPGWAVDGASGADMIGWVEEAAKSGGLAVFIFHGVGGGHSINVAREEHRKLLEWLDRHRDRVWTAPFLRMMEHVIAERKRP